MFVSRSSDHIESAPDIKRRLGNLTIMDVIASNHAYFDVKISPVETINAGTVAEVPIGTTY